MKRMKSESEVLGTEDEASENDDESSGNTVPMEPIWDVSRHDRAYCSNTFMSLFAEHRATSSASAEQPKNPWLAGICVQPERTPEHPDDEEEDDCVQQ